MPIKHIHENWTFVKAYEAEIYKAHTDAVFGLGATHTFNVVTGVDIVLGGDITVDTAWNTATPVIIPADVKAFLLNAYNVSFVAAAGTKISMIMEEGGAGMGLLRVPASTDITYSLSVQGMVTVNTVNQGIGVVIASNGANDNQLIIDLAGYWV